MVEPGLGCGLNITLTPTSGFPSMVTVPVTGTNWNPLPLPHPGSAMRSGMTTSVSGKRDRTGWSPEGLGRTTGESEDRALRSRPSPVTHEFVQPAHLLVGVGLPA